MRGGAKNTLLTVRVSEEFYERLQDVLDADDVTMATFTRSLLEAAIVKREAYHKMRVQKPKPKPPTKINYHDLVRKQNGQK